MRDIVMTVRARHIRNMRQGDKKYELRKTRPGGYRGSDYTREKRFTRIWLCESGTAGRIVATFRCRAFACMDRAGDDLISRLCAITPEEVAGYRKQGKGRLWGWLIEDFEYFKGTGRERHITDFGLQRPPQSWCYAKSNERITEGGERA